jgi:hypothetical protein
MTIFWGTKPLMIAKYLIIYLLIILIPEYHCFFNCINKKTIVIMLNSFV